MVNFEQFKRKPLTREELEEQSRGVKKTGEILRGMEQEEMISDKPDERALGEKSETADILDTLTEGREKAEGDTRILDLSKHLEANQKKMEQIPGYKEITQALNIGNQGRIAQLRKEFPGSFEQLNEVLVEMRNLHKKKEALIEILTERGLKESGQKAA